VGRVDRLDSPHRAIEGYWPRDAQEFALRTDEGFFARHRLVADLLGSNVPLPRVVAAAERSRAGDAGGLEAAEEDWGRISDAFEPVRSLLAGDGPLVPAGGYEQIRTSEARVVSSVGAVVARHAWAFFAIRGTQWGAPRWVYLDALDAAPLTDLAEI